MGSESFRGGSCVIDLESGRNIIEQEGCGGSDPRIGQAKKMLHRVWSGFDRSIKGEEEVGSVSSFSGSVDGPFGSGEPLVAKWSDGEENVGILEKKSGSERPRKKACRKPPKPPRPPKPASLDAADQKLVREISELAMLKRARIERMKALKLMKKAKTSSSSSSLCALVVTILFCVVIIWQGVFSRGSSSVSFKGSPESSVGNGGGLISRRFDRNLSRSPRDSYSASPKYTTLRHLNALRNQKCDGKAEQWTRNSGNPRGFLL